MRERGVGATTKTIVRGAPAPRSADRGEASAPIVAAVEPQTVRLTAETASELAVELGAPVVFVHVRPSSAGNPGTTGHQRRRTRAQFLGHHALDHALATATRTGASAYAEVVKGDPSDRILEFARLQRARLLVVGPPRVDSAAVSRDD
jgi:nucleotide-binding universal stress UspA family protein